MPRATDQFGPFGSSHELLLQKWGKNADATSMRNRSDGGEAALCPSCDGPRSPWFTTCPTCDFPLELGPTAILGHQVAAPLDPATAAVDEWIDLPVSSDQPVKTALLRTFLTDQGFEYEESRRFVSVRSTDASAIEAAMSIWAYHHDMPEDHRHLDTLMSTLKEIGDVTISAIHAATMASTGPRAERSTRPGDDQPGRGSEVDLR